MRIDIVLTASARRFAEARGWRGRLDALALGAWIQLGDRVALEPAAPALDFVVIRRRIAMAPDGGTDEPVLEVTLDYPARE
ncbi:hypothetical protein [Bosea sp. 117]|uniref:hypothetical protein n=1 Tax=Bosea sp. 117 TaxID=1125973 RepID=UPI00068B4744|nr:hypothetical protein [Bosea sp. 117]